MVNMIFILYIFCTICAFTFLHGQNIQNILPCVSSRNYLFLLSVSMMSSVSFCILFTVFFFALLYGGIDCFTSLSSKLGAFGTHSIYYQSFRKMTAFAWIWTKISSFPIGLSLFPRRKNAGGATFFGFFFQEFYVIFGAFKASCARRVSKSYMSFRARLACKVKFQTSRFSFFFGNNGVSHEGIMS